MGYYMSVQDAKFSIKKENIDNAFAAVKALAGKEKENGAGGGTWSPGGERKWYYSWVSGNYANARSFYDAMDDWRWPVQIDSKGSVEGIEFAGEKIGDEMILWKAIAPFVESGSYIEMQGEDGALWRWVFENGKVKEKQAKISWD